MWSICKKELRQFFSSLTGYIAIVVFLLLNGAMLFVFPDNIFDFGYASLEKFFQLAPWILLWLIAWNPLYNRKHAKAPNIKATTALLVRLLQQMLIAVNTAANNKSPR